MRDITNQHLEKLSVKRFGVMCLSIIGVVCGCDDETSGLMPVTSGVEVPSGGASVSGTTPGGASLSGATAGGVSGGARAGEQAGDQAGDPAGEISSCEVSCSEETECTSLECRCPDGRNASFEGCVGGCCLSDITDAEERASACAEQCAALPPAECSLGQSRCLDTSSAAIQRCTPQGEWVLESCQADEVCALDTCLPLDCVDGQTTCLSPRQLAVCSGGAWTMGDECATGACANGTCQTLECAQASLDRSYLGCEYLAIELPNVINNGDTHAPTAVVLTNPSASEEAFIEIFAPNGQPTSLVTEQTLLVPTLEWIPPGAYTNQTIQSEVRDAAGQVVMGRLGLANQASIPPGGTGTFLLPQTIWPETGSAITASSHRIVSDRPVGAYQFAPYCCNFSFSNDASLLIPTSALGQEYVYLGPPSLRTDFLNGDIFYPATGAIIAAEDQTVVRFNVPQSGAIQAETTGRLVESRGAYTVTLNRQETLLLRLSENPPPLFGEVGPQPDLTGAFITADKPVALFSGHECSFYPTNVRACDHLEEQLFPLDVWGQEFFLVPPKERNPSSTSERVYWKIVSQNAGARLQLSATYAELEGVGPGSLGVPDCGQLLDTDGQTIVLNERRYCEFSTKKAVALTASEGVMVMGILSAQESVGGGAAIGSHYGDPSIFLVPPARQARRDYAFLTPATYHSDFATLTFAEGTTISLDGQALDLSDVRSIEGVPQKYVHVELTDGAHKVEGSGPFGITVVAYDDFVSYAFTGGLNLSKR